MLSTVILQRAASGPGMMTFRRHQLLLHRPSLLPFRTSSRSATTTIKSSKTTTKPPSNALLFVKAGLPLILFSLGAAWVLKNALEGKTKEREAFKGTMSKSERQYRLQQEQDEMMEKITAIKKQEFDNTKRIERPEEILERRKRERERRNVWYRRLGRWIMRRE